MRHPTAAEAKQKPSARHLSIEATGDKAALGR